MIQTCLLLINKILDTDLFVLMRQENPVIPTRLCYFLLSLTLTGVLASLEANRSFGSQRHLNNQQHIHLFWSHTGLANLINPSHDNNASSFQNQG